MMRRFGLPVLPLIIGVILGPRVERQLRQSPATRRRGLDKPVQGTRRDRCLRADGILLLMPLVLKLMHRPEETLLIVEDDKDQREKAEA